jgi:hypothetical protein
MFGEKCKAYSREKCKTYRLWVAKPKVKRPPGRPTCKLDDNVNIDLRETGWGGMDSICLAEDRDL